MSLSWIRETAPSWDQDKARILGGAPPGSLALNAEEPGAALAGEWWRAEEEGAVLGYGWMDVVWGDGEIALAVDPVNVGRGVGSFIVEELVREAADHGLRYVYNAVLPTHPRRAAVTAWLVERGFVVGDGGRRLQRRVPST